MDTRMARGSFFDASALLKVFTEEHGSDVLRKFFQDEPTKYTTPFCFYEALNGLKSKWLYRNLLSHDQYRDAGFRLTTWYETATRRIKDVEFENREIFVKVKEIVTRYAVDFSDAFQIISVKHGYYSPLARESQTILVTCDKRLSEVARDEGLRVWFAPDEPVPGN